MSALGTDDAHYSAEKNDDMRLEIESLAREHAIQCMRIIAHDLNVSYEDVRLTVGHVRGIRNAVRRGIEGMNIAKMPAEKIDDARVGLASIVEKLQGLFPELEPVA